ncbi:MAG: HlyD family type I secretion periplasmic adaptor subunit [Pseudomonadota bacterium]
MTRPDKIRPDPMRPEPAHLPPAASPVLHLTALTTLGAFAALLAVAILCRIEIVATGTARLVPAARVQAVQAEHAGRLDAILVDDGDRVVAGQPLARLDATEARAELGQIRAEIARLQAEAARHARLVADLDRVAARGAGAAERRLAAASGALAPWPAAPLSAPQQRLLEAETARFADRLAEIDARVATLDASAAVIEAAIAELDARLAIEAERLATATTLHAKDLAPRARLLDATEAHVEVQRRIEVEHRRLAQARREAAALRAERAHAVSARRAELLDRAAEIEGQRATLAQQRIAAERRLAATDIRAPMDGVVNGLAVFTVGGVVQAGADLMTIVPTGGGLIVEAQFSNADVGFLAEGQRAKVELDAFPAERFQALGATVAQVSHDAVEVEDAWAFTVRLTLAETAVSTAQGPRPVGPGMTGTVNVVTGERRLIGYFFAPIVDTLQNSLNER